MTPLLPPGHTYGTVVNRRAVAGFTLKEVVYPGDLVVPEHAHEWATFYAVLEGAYTEVYGKTILAPRPFGLAFHPARVPHWHHCHHASGRCFTVGVAPHWIERVHEYSRVLDHPTDLQLGMPASLFMRLYREFLRDDGAAPLAIEGLAVEILAETSRRCDHSLGRVPPRWLRQVRDLLHTRYAESLTLEEIAGAAGVHPGHLTQVFRRHHRCTIGEYVRRLRVDFVCGELARSDTPLAELALAAGFADQSHLTRTFKRLIGMTPAQFRAATRAA